MTAEMRNPGTAATVTGVNETTTNQLVGDLKMNSTKSKKAILRDALKIANAALTKFKASHPDIDYSDIDRDLVSVGEILAMTTRAIRDEEPDVYFYLEKTGMELEDAIEADDRSLSQLFGEVDCALSYWVEEVLDV